MLLDNELPYACRLSNTEFFTTLYELYNFTHMSLTYLEARRTQWASYLAFLKKNVALRKSCVHSSVLRKKATNYNTHGTLAPPSRKKRKHKIVKHISLRWRQLSQANPALTQFSQSSFCYSLAGGTRVVPMSQKGLKFLNTALHHVLLRPGQRRTRYLR